MKKFTLLTLMILTAVSLSFAQTKEEQEVLAFNAEYEKAQTNRDVAFFERVFVDDYTYSGPQGEVEDKAKAIKWLKDQNAKPTYKMVSMKSENLRAKVFGNNAILTGTWIGTSLPIADALAGPHTDRGRYTAFLEKRNGQWVILAEHVSEAPHDRKLMEQEVLKASDMYTALIIKPEKAGLERLFADEFIYTNSDGMTRAKAAEIAHMTAGDVARASAQATDRKIHILSNSSAIETGTFNVKGTSKGKAFDETERYTTAWVWRGGRWQVAADHTSAIKAK